MAATLAHPMSDLDKALSQANKVMARKPGAPEEESAKPDAGRKIIGVLVGSIIVVCAAVGGYILWMNISDAKSRAVASRSAPPPPESIAPSVQPTSPPPSLSPPPADPGLAMAFDKMALNAILSNPPRAQLNGKIFELKDELIPGLTLLRIEKDAIVAVDSLGATYRRTF